jgi:hypothetical protein
MSGQPPPDRTTPAEWLPPEPGRNLTPYAVGAIGVLVLGGVLRVVPPSLALVLIVVVIGVMSTRRRRENRTRFEAELRLWHAQHSNPQQVPAMPPPTGPPKSGWSIAGTVVAVMAVVGGLAVLAMAVTLFFVVSSGKFGNK